MAFEQLDISVTGDAADAQAALQSVKRSLRGVDRAADSASDSLEETGDSVSGLTLRLSGLAASSATSAASLIGLSSVTTGTRGSMLGLAASTGTVIAGLLTLSAVAAPLAATLGGVATGVASVAGVFAGGFLAAAVTETERLKNALSDAKEGILDAIAPVGEAFADALIPLIGRLPSVAEQVVEAVGPLDDFTAAVRDTGNALLDAVPGIAAFAADLTREALPVLRELASGAAEAVPSAIRTMLDTTRRLGDDLLSLVGPAREFAGTLLEVGTPLVEDVVPAIKLLLGPLGKALTLFGEVSQSEGAQQTFQEVQKAISRVVPSTEQLIDIGRGVIDFFTDIVSREDATEIFNSLRSNVSELIPKLVEFGGAVKPILSDLVDELPGVINAVGTVAVDLAELATTFTNTVRPAVRVGIDIIAEIVDIFNNLPAPIQKSVVGLGALYAAIPAVVGAAYSLGGALAGVGTALTSVVAILGGPLTLAIGAGATALLAYQQNWLGFRDKVQTAVSEVKMAADTLVNIFRTTSRDIESAWSYLTGRGPGSLVGDVKGGLNSLKTFFEETFTLDALTSIFETAAGELTAALEDIIPDPLVNAIGSLISDVKTLFENLNQLPDIDLSFDSIAPDGGGPGAGQPGGGRARPGGISVGAATGGLVESTGAAVIHEGERVVPEAQVIDRGPAPVAGGGTGSGMPAGELERVMRAAVDDAMRSALSGARLSVDGDVASIEDVDRRVEERQRRTARRLDARDIR
jgi:phage-related protein